MLYLGDEAGRRNYIAGVPHEAGRKTKSSVHAGGFRSWSMVFSVKLEVGDKDTEFSPFRIVARGGWVHLRLHTWLHTWLGTGELILGLYCALMSVVTLSTRGPWCLFLQLEPCSSIVCGDRKGFWMNVPIDVKTELSN